MYGCNNDVLSLCTEAEFGFQNQNEEKENAVEVVVVTAGAAAAATTALAALASASAPAFLLSSAVGATYFVGKYVYKRAKWNDEAKEREFKCQFVGHVTKKQQLIVDSTSANCSHQVQQ